MVHSELFGSTYVHSNHREPVPFGGNTEEFDTGRVYQDSGNEKFYIRQNNIPIIGFDESASSSRAVLLGHELARSTPALYYPLTKIYGLNHSNLRYEPEDEFNGGTDLSFSGITEQKASSGFNAGLLVSAFQASSSAVVRHNEIGSKSFFFSIEVREDSFNSESNILSFGEHFHIKYRADNTLEVRSGSDVNTIPASFMRDGAWHRIGVLVDKSTQTYKVFLCDSNYNTRSYDILSNIATFVQEDMIIGGGFTGNISNLFLFTWGGSVDYNAVKMVLAGIRDNPNKGMTISAIPHSNNRYNNQIRLTGDDNSYTYAMLDLDEGNYDIFLNQYYGLNRGTLLVTIDGINRVVFDTNTASTARQLNRLRDTNLPKGHVLVKLTKVAPISGTGAEGIHLSHILFNKTSGSDEGGASQFTILGEELTESSMEVIGLNNNPYNSLLRGLNDGDYALGTVYLAGGNWTLFMNYRYGPNYGIFGIYVNGKLMKTFDGYNSGYWYNRTVPFNISLPQGRNRIEIRTMGKRSESLGHNVLLMSLNGRLNSGKSRDNYSIVHAFDMDIDNIGSGTFRVDRNQNAYFAQELDVPVGRRSDVRRYFAGGDTIFRYLGRVNPDSGSGELWIDNQRIFTFDFNHTTPVPVALTHLVKVEEGYHDISIRNTGTGVIHFSALETEVLTNSGTTVYDAPQTEVLAVYKAKQRERSVVFNFLDLAGDKYEKLRILVNLRTYVAGNTVSMRINGITANNYKAWHFGKNQASPSVEAYQLLDKVRLNIVGLAHLANHNLTSDMSLIFGNHNTDGSYIVHGSGTAQGHDGYENVSWILESNPISEIDKIEIFFEGDINWEDVSTITIYGELRKQ